MKTNKPQVKKIVAAYVDANVADAFAAKCKARDVSPSARLRRLITNEVKKELSK